MTVFHQIELFLTSASLSYFPYDSRYGKRIEEVDRFQSGGDSE